MTSCPPVTWRILFAIRCARHWTCQRSCKATARSADSPPYHPGMLVALLLYGYSRGVYSSRQLARACEERMDFMAVTGLNQPDFRTVSNFRKRHLTALSGLFVQMLRLCERTGLVKFGHVAVDGTKLKANASRHKAMSYQRMLTEEPKLAVQVKAWQEQAESIPQAWAAGCLRAIVPTLEDRGILFIHLDECSEGLDPEVRECQHPVVAVAVDPNDAIFGVHFFGDVMEPIHAFPEFPGDTVDGFDGMNLVGVHDQAAWAALSDDRDSQFHGSSSSNR